MADGTAAARLRAAAGTAAFMATCCQARPARLRCEADVLRPLGMRDKLGCVDRVLAQGCIGPLFLRQVNALRAMLASSLHAVAEA